MNLIEISNMLKGMPDEYLTKHVQQPDGTVPQFLALSEISRRQDMRARFAQPPQSTVADDIMAKGSGIQPQAGVRPQANPPQTAPAPRGYAGGGIVGWQDPAAELIKEYEGLRLNQYNDIGGVPTIGYGRTGGILPTSINADQANQYLEEDMKEANSLVKQYVKAPLAPNEEAALTSAAYNLGPQLFVNKDGSKTRVAKALEAGDKAAAAEALTLFNKVKGKPVSGLTRRRAAEKDMFLADAGIASTAGGYTGQVFQPEPDTRSLQQRILDGLNPIPEARADQKGAKDGKAQPPEKPANWLDNAGYILRGLGSAGEGIQKYFNDAASQWTDETPVGSLLKNTVGAGERVVGDTLGDALASPEAARQGAEGAATWPFRPWGSSVGGGGAVPSQIAAGAAPAVAPVVIPDADTLYGRKPAPGFLPDVGFTPADIPTPAPTAPPDAWDTFAKQLTEHYASIKGDAGERRRMALLQAGLGIAAGESPFFATNVGRGAQVGVDYWNKDKAASQAQGGQAITAQMELMDKMLQNRREDARLGIAREQLDVSKQRADAYSQAALARGAGKSNFKVSDAVTAYNAELKSAADQGIIMEPKQKEILWQTILARMMNAGNLAGASSEGNQSVPLEPLD